MASATCNALCMMIEPQYSLDATQLLKIIQTYMNDYQNEVVRYRKVAIELSDNGTPIAPETFELTVYIGE